MVQVGREAAALRRWSQRQRLTALKRIIPLAKVTAALRRTGRGQTFCARTPDVFMLWFVVAMGLCSGVCYRQIYRWLWPWKKGDVPGRSTLCEARRRLGVAPLVQLAARVVELLATPQTPGAYYAGLRLMAVDGFALNLPDTPANERAFGRPRNQRRPGAFPQCQVLALVEAGTHVFWRWLIKGCHIDETRLAPPLLRHLRADMLLLWDRGFASCALVRQVVRRRAHLLARWKTNRILTPVRRLSDGSFLARLYASGQDRRAGTNGLLVRVIEYTLREPARTGQGEKHRLITTLLDPHAHPAQTLVELYHQRWEQELAIDELKTHQMQRPVLRSQTPAGVVQEIYGLLLAHYVLRSLMCQAAQRAKVAPVRLSFTGTLQILQCRLPECPRSTRGRRQWWQQLLAEIAEEQLPPRRNRINPRVKKRPHSPWSAKRPRHRHWPQPRQTFADSVVILR
jgi:hypothetical protein